MPTWSASLRSLNSRALPGWYDDAKFGIFIHWGLFSIPAFAPNYGKISDVFRDHYDKAVTLTPYCEWYENAIRDPDSPSAQFHRENYGSAPYADFKAAFNEGLSEWDPDAWAKLFAESGAKYVVLVSKHHDGYCLWPSDVKNPKRGGWTSQRDIVGELAQAVRKYELHFGLYYSGGIDWSFNTQLVSTFADFVGSVPGGRYQNYADQQVRELIQRYKPDILWNDISWPGNFKNLLNLFADYYNQVPEGVVNDRWVHTTHLSGLKRTKLARRMLDWMAKWYIKRHPEKVDGVIPQKIPHSDFRTPEYASFTRTQNKKWEATKGMSHSFGYNRNDTEADYESAAEILAGFIDSISKNGNLLLNVGPRGSDAQIPQAQVMRLKAIGEWLAINGEAVYASRPWRYSEAVSNEGCSMRFTCRGQIVYLFLMDKNYSTTLRLYDLPDVTKIWRLGVSDNLNFEYIEKHLVISIPENFDKNNFPVLALHLGNEHSRAL